MFSLDAYKVQRGGYMFETWDLENQKPMKGKASRRVIELIGELESGRRL